MRCFVCEGDFKVQVVPSQTVAQVVIVKLQSVATPSNYLAIRGGNVHGKVCPCPCVFMNCLSVCLCVCLSVCVFICVYVSMYMHLLQPLIYICMLIIV